MSGWSSCGSPSKRRCGTSASRPRTGRRTRRWTSHAHEPATIPAGGRGRGLRTPPHQGHQPLRGPPDGHGQEPGAGEDRLRRGDALGRSRPHPRPCEGIAGTKRRQGAEALPRTEGRRLFRRPELARHAGVRHRGGDTVGVQQGLRPRTLRPRHRGRVPPHKRPTARACTAPSSRT
jgi:hypothetical protein